MKDTPELDAMVQRHRETLVQEFVIIAAGDKAVTPDSISDCWDQIENNAMAIAQGLVLGMQINYLCLLEQRQIRLHKRFQELASIAYEFEE